jgi:thioredoxin 1
MKNTGKILIIATLVIIVVAVIIMKNKPQSSEISKKELTETVETETMKLDELNSMQIEKEQEQEQKTETQIEKQDEKKENVATSKKTERKTGKKAEKDVLAIVEGQTISKSDFETSYNTLPPQYKEMFKNNKDGYLEQMIIKELLFQQAQKEGFTNSSLEKDKQIDEAIQKLLTKQTADMEIPKHELQEFYEQNKGQMQGATYEQVESDIRNYVMQQKQNELIEQYVEGLRQNADVVLNEKWMKEQTALKPKNPLSEALKNGLPTVLDLGADSCIPCKMMKPIFAELETELKGKANILLLEISEYRDIANEYKVRVIPTQIFFDQKGKQYWRHEGFLSKEDILKKIEETGAKL